MNILIFIDNWLENLTNKTQPKITTFKKNSLNFEEFMIFFLSIFPKLTDALSKFREIYRNWPKFRETDS